MSKEAMEGLLKTQVYEGVIYKITRYKDEFGNKLIIPEVYIGQSNDYRSRWTAEIRAARIGKYGKRNLFLPVIAKHFSKDATSVNDAFDFEVIDLCYSQKEMNLKETFYMDFYDTNNPDYGGLTYYRGPSAWGITYKQVGREELFNKILEGKEFKDLQQDFGVSETTLRKRFGKYILPMLEHIPNNIYLSTSVLRRLNQLKIKFEQSSEGTLGINDAKFAILTLNVAPKLLNLIRSGFTLKASLDWLSQNNIKFIENRVSKNIQNSIMNRVCRRIWGKNYAQLRMELFIEPLVEDLRNQGIDFIIGEGTERIDPLELQDLLDRRVDEKIIIGENAQELGLIERLALSGLKGFTEIANALHILDSTTPQGTKRKAVQSVVNYVIYRWGAQYRNFNKFVEFLKTNFLGRD